MDPNASFLPGAFVRFLPRLGSRVGRGSPFRRRLQRDAVFALLLLTVLVGPNGVLTAMTALAAPVQPKAPLAALIPMTQDRALAAQAAVWGHGTPHAASPGSASVGPTTAPTGLIIPRQVVPPQPSASGSATLSATTATTVTTSDGRLSLTVPAGAVKSSDLAAVGGPVKLRITQLSGPVGGGPSGRVSLGTYRLELIGPKGHVGGLAFQQPLTLRL